MRSRTSVALVAFDNTTTYSASAVTFDTFTQLTATFNLAGVPQGVYSVQVTNNTLPNDMLFQALGGLPNTAATVPDGFGNGGTAIDFDQGVAGGIKNQVMFLPDGSARDTNGSLNSGIIYVARTADLYSSRSVTLYGATGRIRGWRLINSAGAPIWFQQ